MVMVADLVPGLKTWIAPLGTGAPVAATFDPNAASQVIVCAWNGNSCTAAPIASKIESWNKAAWSIYSPLLVLVRAE